MPPTIADVMALPGLGLRLVGGADGVTNAVRWVATSELLDPGPFLQGGELLLTTGMRLGRGSSAARAYVDRLQAVGIAALGVGIGLTHDLVPPALIAAAEGAGLPLLEVAAPTPFIAISKAVSDLLAAEQYEEVARGFAAQRDLTRALSTEGGASALVGRLARQVDGWALLLDGAGRLRHAAPPSAADRHLMLSGELARLRPRGALASASLATPDGHVVIQPIGVSGRAAGFLAVGRSGPFSPTQQTVVNFAVSLLAMDSDRSQGRERALRRVRSASLAAVVAGADAAALPWEDLGWGQLLEHQTIRVLSVRGEAAALARSLARAEHEHRLLAAALIDESLALLCPAEPAALEAALALREPGCSGGVGPITSLAGGSAAGVSFPAAWAAADRAARMAAGRQPGSVVEHDSVASLGLAALVDPDLARGFAEQVLAPLQVEAALRADLAQSVAAWLGHHGQWDVAAAELGIHRHTLRHRVQRAAELLGRDLDDPGVRVELWFALQVLEVASKP